MWSIKKLTELCAGSTLYVSNANAVDAIKVLTAQVATMRVILITTISPWLCVTINSDGVRSLTAQRSGSVA
jgi:hypothetical protein